MAATVAAVLLVSGLILHMRNLGPTSYGPPIQLAHHWLLDEMRTSSDDESLVISGQWMFLISRDNAARRAACVSVTDMALRWESDVECHSVLAANERLIFCLTGAAGGAVALNALDIEDGSLAWQYVSDERSARRSAAVLADGRICLATDQTIHLINADNGSIIWKTAIKDDGPLSTPAILNEQVFIASASSLHCLDVGTGQVTVSHQYNLEQDVRLRPLLAVEGQHIYIAQKQLAGEDRIFALDASTKQVIWSETVSPVTHMLATAGELFMRGSIIEAIDARTGQQLWSHQASGCSPLSLNDGMVYFVDANDNGRLLALDPRSGKQMWELAGLHSCSSFQRVGDRGFLKTQDGVIHVLAFAK